MRCKYSDIAGFLYSGTKPYDFSFLTLAVLARRAYKDMFMNANFRVQTVLKNENPVGVRVTQCASPVKP